MKFITTLRIILVVHVVALFIQSSFAGYILAGNGKAVILHGLTGRLIVLLGLVQLAAIAVKGRKGLCPTWVLMATIGVLLAEVTEFIAGHQRIMELHVPLGIAIFGAVLRQLFWVFREVRLSPQVPARTGHGGIS